MRPSRSTFASIAVAVAVSLLASGCGGGGAPGVANVTTPTTHRGGGSAAATSQAAAMLLAGRCLRSHGLSGLPDPSIATAGPAKGQPILDKQALRAFPQPAVNRALSACRSELARAGVRDHGGARTPQEIRDGLAFARCVRRHGISNFPDPDGQGSFDLAGTGINPHALTPAELAAARACLPAAHGAIKLPAQNGSAGSGG